MARQVFAVILGIVREGWQDVTLYESEIDAKEYADSLNEKYNTKDTSYYVSVLCWDIL